MHKNAAALLFCIVALTSLADVMTAQTPLDPQKAVTLADVQSLLKGKFAARTVEPGLVKYEEIGGAREVEIFFFIQSPGKTVSGVKEASLQNSEPVEDVTGLGDAAIYRPQGVGIIVEKKSKAGDLQWLEIRVHNVEGPDRVALLSGLPSSWPSLPWPDIDGSRDASSVAMTAVLLTSPSFQPSEQALV